MTLKSNFKSDLKKEQLLTKLLDKTYSSKLKHYSFERIRDLNEQYKGVDVVFKHKTKACSYFIDEKAQLDYINEDLPTFAFELSYLKNTVEKKGWLFDENKKTDFYALITAIFLDGGEYSSCKITLVNRKKLLKKLDALNFKNTRFQDYRSANSHGKIVIDQLNQKKEGYLFLSSKNKIEQPLNLVLRLDWLLETKIAKRLI